MQEYIKLNGVLIRQPDEGLGYEFETTYTEDTTRTMDGTLYSGAMFTVESFSYEASWLTQEEMSAILQIVAKGVLIIFFQFFPIRHIVLVPDPVGAAFSYLSI